MNLAEFIDNFRDAIARRVVESYPPLYRPSENGHRLPELLRSPLGAQADAIRGAALSLRANRGTTVVGEMGTGKTFIATAAAHMAGFRRILVLVPPSPGAQVEARDRGDRARRPCRHRHLHHRPRATAHDRRRRTALRGDEPGTRQAVVPMAARRRRALGRSTRQALP